MKLSKLSSFSSEFSIFHFLFFLNREAPLQSNTDSLHSDNYIGKDMTALTLELQDFCKKSASPYKYPREIEFVTELPKTVSGKIRRVELRNAEYESVIRYR